MSPKFGCINLHFSLLPKYRGAAPMQWALVNGESETGVSAFWLDEKMDEGPLFHVKKVSLSQSDDIFSLREN
jgi:methionyl-tRNA formyltransferase